MLGGRGGGGLVRGRGGRGRGWLDRSGGIERFYGEGYRGILLIFLR